MVAKIAVIGAGEMGHGIAELAALNGFQVSMVDIKQEFIDRGMERVRWSLGKLVDSKQITEAQRDEILQRIQGTIDLKGAVRDADIVIEAILEDLELKKKVFAQLDAAAPPGAILASNTSGLSITAMGRATKRPAKVVGMHFFNPAILMPLVEIIKGEDTSQETIQAIADLSKALRKTSVVCRKDVPGFITSRTIAPYVLEAAWIHHDEGVPKEVIDSALKFKVGFPMGPFELADQIGVDLMASATKAAGLPVPPPIEALAMAGKFGKKTGEGFYDYRGGGKAKITPDLGAAFDPMRVLAPVFAVAAGLVEEDVATPAEIDEAMRLGTAFPKGPLALADEYGIDEVVAALRGHKRYPTPKILEAMVAKGDLGVKSGKGFYEHEAEAKAAAYETILVTRDAESKVATITLNRPDRLNTITAEMIDELEGALLELAPDPEVRCLVLAGAGEKAFCAGADVSTFGSVDKAHKAWGHTRRWNEVYRRLAEFPKPTLAAIHGYALGGGCELAIACDFRIAAQKAKVGQTELNLGLIPGTGGISRLVKLLGLARAKEVVLTARRLDASEAREIGLVTRVVGNEEFPAAVKEFAEKLAKAPPIAYRLAKEVLNRAPDISVDASIEKEALAFGVVTSSEDIYEGIQALMEKREPKFKGE